MKLDFFEKQLLIDNFSEKLKKKIFNTKCLVIGGGGIAHPLLTYLVSTGFGNISIVDKAFKSSVIRINLSDLSISQPKLNKDPLCKICGESK
mgnify:CR=1 FL=1